MKANIVSTETFLFKDPDRTRANQGSEHPSSTIVKKKTYNRGNHHNAKYPNEAFRKYNESKMLAAVNEKDPEFIKDYNEIRKQYKKDKAAKDYEKAKLKPVRYYGKMLYGGENSLWEKELKYKQELDKGSGSFHLTGKPYVEAQKIVTTANLMTARLRYLYRTHQILMI